ncbi:putative inactive 1-aminocyclopropane-1-carboxylate synthase-like protein 2 [Dama dama]
MAYLFTDSYVPMAVPLLLVTCSSQPGEANGNTQGTSGPSHTPHTPCVPMRDQALRYRSIHTQLMEMVLTLRQTVEDHIMHLTTRPQQQDGQAIREQEALLGRLLFQIISFLPAGAQSFQPPCTSTDSRGDVGGGQPVQTSRQTGQMFYQESDFENTVISYDLSNRGIDISALYDLSFRDYDTYQGNKYHKDKNTLGYINLGTSENKLCTDLLAERLSQSDMTYIDEDLLQYTDWRGQPFLRKEVARFLTFYCKTPEFLDPENVVILNGCSAVFSALAMVLCDPGEAFLVPTPFYGGFAFSTHLYSKVKLIPVHLESQVTEANGYPFQLTVDKLEQALLGAKIEGKKVRGLVLINPQNPLGDVYSQDSMMEYLEFAKKYNLHVIVDEMYMLSVFDEAITFHSVLSMKSLPDPNKTHVIWGTSKDFCISGFHFGALYTHNREVASAMSSFGYLHSISGITQYKLRQLLQDREWIDNIYLPSYHLRLQEAHRYVTHKLKALKVPFLNRGSGLYVWINLKQYMDPCTFEEELLLHRRFLDHKLILSPGKTFMCKEPGWFRLIFAARPHLLRIAMRRFQQVLVEQEQERRVKQLEDAMKEEVSTSQPETPASPALRKS